MTSLEYNGNLLLHDLVGSSGHAQKLFISKVILFTAAENGICHQPTNHISY
jgi:hypothetical protein